MEPNSRAMQALGSTPLQLPRNVASLRMPSVVVALEVLAVEQHVHEEQEVMKA